MVLASPVLTRRWLGEQSLPPAAPEPLGQGPPAPRPRDAGPRSPGRSRSCPPGTGAPARPRHHVRVEVRRHNMEVRMPQEESLGARTAPRADIEEAAALLEPGRRNRPP